MVEDNTKEIMDQMDPGLRAALEKLRVAIQQSPLKKEVGEFRNIISKTPPLPEQAIFSFLPHQMAKISIFFPMSDRELKEENRKINKIEQETGWGKVIIEGIKLSIFEEDVFLALMKIAKEDIKINNGAYILKTHMNTIVNLLYGRGGYTKQSSERVERALQHFQLVRFELTTFDWKKKGNERLKTTIVRSIGNIIQSYEYDKKTKDLVIYFNPHFFAYFLESMLTNINYTLRRHLKKDGSKALLRFLSTHSRPGRMHILTVLNAINYNINQPMFELRRKFKSFISELRENNVLDRKTKLFKDDTVHFDIIHPKRALPD